MRSGMRSNSAFEETQAADLAAFTGGSAYGAAGFGVRAAPPHSSSRQQQPGGFDPDPRLFGSAADASEAAVLRDDVQAIVLAGDALEPPTSTSSTLLQSPAGVLGTLQVNDPWQSLPALGSSRPPCHLRPLHILCRCTFRARNAAGRTRGHRVRRCAGCPHAQSGQFVCCQATGAMTYMAQQGMGYAKAQLNVIDHPKICCWLCHRLARRMQCGSMRPSAARGPGSCGQLRQGNCSAPPATWRCAMRYGASRAHLSRAWLMLLYAPCLPWRPVGAASAMDCFVETACSIS